jgi:hypothetical protein
VKRITTTRAGEADAVWSPDGRRIGVVRARHCAGPSLVYSIWTMSRRATDGQRIYQDGCRATEELGGPPLVSWQPLGAR